MNINIAKVDLTKEQQDCVNFDSGDLLVKGVAGAGKSYVIMRRALKFYRENSGGKSIKLFTYANSLVKYTDDLFKTKIESDAIEVLTVDSYCLKVYSRMTGKAVRFKGYCNRRFDYTMITVKEHKQYINEIIDKNKKTDDSNHRFYSLDVSYWIDEFDWICEKCIHTKSEYLNADRRGRGSAVRMKTNDKELAWKLYSQFRNRMEKEKKITWPDLYFYINDNINRIPEYFKIDYILVDEAQDMTYGKMRFLKALAKTSITIAADVAQKIYKTSFTWKEVGVNIQGRSSKELSKSFRSTKEIVTLAEDLMVMNRKITRSKGEYTDQVIPEVSGSMPKIYKSSSVLHEREFLCNYINRLISNKNIVVGVICRTNNHVNELMSLLTQKNIKFQHIDNRKPDKAEWTLLEPGVKIVTAHSSKGLEFDVVIIPHMNQDIFPLNIRNIEEDQLEEYLATERSILYVAMTRARRDLAIFCNMGAESQFINEFQEKNYEVVFNE